MKDELHNVLSGKSQVRHGKLIQTVSRYLAESSSTSPTIENTKQYKKQEAERIEKYIHQNNLWVHIDFSQYVSEGAEQRVYLSDDRHVIKLNDAIYYNSWQDYFHNLLLHNYFFADTAYELIGFTKDNEILYAIVKQNFVTSTDPTDLQSVKSFLKNNGFENNRNNDYLNSQLGIILEDLHDENVLTKDQVLYFIDTVFYLTDDFWK